MSTSNNEKNVTISGGVNAINLGKHWAAIDAGDKIIGLISMGTPNRISGEQYEEYATKAKAALAVLGNVKSGEVIFSDGTGYMFRKNLSHKNRSKNPDKVREPQLYSLDFINQT